MILQLAPNLILLIALFLYIISILIASYISLHSKPLTQILKKKYYLWIQIFMILSFSYSTLILIQTTWVDESMRIILVLHQLFIAYVLYLFYLSRPLRVYTSNYKLIIYHFGMIIVIYYSSLLLRDTLIFIMYVLMVLAYTFTRFRYSNEVISCKIPQKKKSKNETKSSNLKHT